MAFLFLADHAEHLSKLIKPALAEGKDVITDRCIDSRYAYQGVTLKKYFQDPIKWLKKIHEPFSVVPDRTILLVTDVDVAIERISRKGRKRIKLEDKDFLEKVQRNYLELVEDERERFIKIDANAELDFVERTVERELKKILS
ncbi:MAG: thymidylate kinase [Candidatus Methanolliviera sp. GoM_asphalt]|nr:MAG: thymidylate kinase [Candidatus Methanolliviera sp. GoM_asphalt]